MAPVKFEESPSKAAITDQVVGAPDRDLEQVLRGTFKVENETFRPLWLLPGQGCRLLNQ